MPMSVEDRVRKASAARIANARERRFRRYVEEMDESPQITLDVQESLAEIMRDLGWRVTRN